jgi:hypothetical protein
MNNFSFHNLFHALSTIPGRIVRLNYVHTAGNNIRSNNYNNEDNKKKKLNKAEEFSAACF